MKSITATAILWMLAGTASADTRLDMAIGGQTLAESTGAHTEWRYQWPAIYFESRFKGPEVTLDLDDSSNTFNVLIDGKMFMQLDRPGTRRITLNDLGAGSHTIRLEKRSETQYATGAFRGFFVPAKADALPAPAYPREIEVIGDSATVGYGNTSAFTKCSVEDIFATTDSQQGPVVLSAKHFGAAYRINAFSGLGMVRNYDGHEHPKYHMPMLYPRAVFDDARADSSPWAPQIIAVAIGGNDFSTDLHADEPWKTRADLLKDYTETYVRFVKTVRQKNPKAFLLIVGPSPDRKEYADAVIGVFDALKASGETRIDHLTLPKTDNMGCNSHPNTHDDAKVAQMYIDYIESHPDLWQRH
ncbi:SGNH/GDSL hydrolase family protein [Asticcacaulis solisilvae]|uniref:SGNH/GDSL hydrolase family protein n=1 Tax=Asticcacaulis solisilvae TaxID=1217274 RepID=UPI003FD73FA7